MIYALAAWAAYMLASVLAFVACFVVCVGASLCRNDTASQRWALRGIWALHLAIPWGWVPFFAALAAGTIIDS